ncbi:MAG: hypothetical protein KJ607_10200 [Bacteroidetes bacterium]|nr:hypothetical protein [Bacteroidota bacterium]
MALPRFIKLPKPKQFNYIPRYYDEAKEQREERLRHLRAESDSDKDSQFKEKEEWTPDIKGRFRSHYRRTRNTRSGSALRLVIILAVLFALAFYLFYS